MDSISNSGVSLILNPDIANEINDNRYQHDLSTCEEEFENPEEIQQMLVNAFESQSLSNTDNEAHEYEDDEDEDRDQSPIDNVTNKPNQINTNDNIRFEEENKNLRHRIEEYITNDELYRKKILEYEHLMNEISEKHEQNCISLRLEYETKIEQLKTQASEKQIEMLTLKQMYETIYDEKCYNDQQINELRAKEQNLQDQLQKLQIDYEDSLKSNRKPLKTNVLTQTDNPQEIDNLRADNIQLNHQLTQLNNQLKLFKFQIDEREQTYLNEKAQYEKHIQNISKRPIRNSIQLQTDFIENEDKKLKQLQTEIDDYKLKLNSKQMEINSIKFDYDNLKQEMNDRLSLITSNVSMEQLNKVISERDQHLKELNQLKTEIPQLKQQMIDSFQTKMITFKEQVKKSLSDKENEYRKKVQQVENEYITQYEQVLEKNKQVVRSLIASKQDEFNNEKNQIITEYEEKLKLLQKRQLSDNERRSFEQKVEELTRANEQYMRYIGKVEKEYRQREKTSINIQQHDEIHRLYDQIAKQNQQQIHLIDEHQKQIEQLKTTYDERYRVILDELKTYNKDLHENNAKLKTKLKEYEKTIVQLRYHIINLQIEYLQNGGNSNKMIQIEAQIK